MSDYELTTPPEIKPEMRDPDNWEKHRREVRYQIMLPLAIGVFIVIILSILVIMGSYADTSQWADVAIIWMAMPALIATFIILVILGGIAYGMARLLMVLPGYMAQIQDFFKLIGETIKGITNRMVEPILGIEDRKASWRALMRSFSRK